MVVLTHFMFLLLFYDHKLTNRIASVALNLINFHQAIINRRRPVSSTLFFFSWARRKKTIIIQYRGQQTRHITQIGGEDPGYPSPNRGAQPMRLRGFFTANLYPLERHMCYLLHRYVTC